MNEQLEQQLRSHTPATELPAGLHSGIMAAVRSSTRAEMAPRRVPVLAVAGPAFALLLIGTMLLYLRTPTAAPVSGRAEVPSLAAGPAALEMGNQLADTSGRIVNPLAEELRKVNADLAAAAEQVLCALP